MTFAVLCAGQGHQHARMLDVALVDARAQATLVEATRALNANPREWLDRPDDLFDNAIAQPLICVAELATWRALRERIPTPALFAGYSVGELAAYACADALDVEPLCRLAVARAEAMNAANGSAQGTLVAVHGLDRQAIASLCERHHVFQAIVMSEATFVVGGRLGNIERFAEAVRSHSGSINRLRVGVPAHTPLLATAVPAFRAALEALMQRAPTVPVVAGIDGSLVGTRELALRTLSCQVAQTVEWLQCVQTLYERGCRVFVEIGPGTALARALRERFTDVEARSVDDFRSLDGMAAWVAARTG